MEYVDRDWKRVAETLVKPDADGRSTYSNRQGTQATFVNGRLIHFLTNSPFTEFSVTRRGDTYTLPMSVADANKLFGQPVSTTSDRDKRPGK